MIFRTNEFTVHDVASVEVAGLVFDIKVFRGPERKKYLAVIVAEFHTSVCIVSRRNLRAMTIKDPIDEPKSKETSYDPFSTLGTEPTSNDTSLSYDPFTILDQGTDPKDPVTPFEVEQNTPIATATTATPVAGRIGSSSDCPLLQGVPTNQLPLRFQRLLDVHNTINDPDTVEFYPGHIPSTRLLYYFILADVVVTFVLFQNWFFPKEGDEFDFGSYSFIVFPVVIVLSSIASIYVVFRLKKRRAPLNARDSQGNKKPFPGDWKGGIYLVGDVGLLEYNQEQEKAWLFPLESIVSIEHCQRTGTRGRDVQNGITLKIVLGSGQETEHESMLNEDNYWWVKVQQWFDRCKNGDP